MEKRLREIQARKAAIRSALDAATDEEITAFETELSKLEAEEATINKRSAIAQRLNSGELAGTPVFEQREQEYTPEMQEREKLLESQEYRSAWLKDLKGDRLSDVEKRAITSAADSGGAVIPTITLNKVIEKLKQISIIYPLVYFEPHFLGNRAKMPKPNGMYPQFVAQFQ